MEVIGSHGSTVCSPTTNLADARVLKVAPPPRGHAAVPLDRGRVLDDELGDGGGCVRVGVAVVVGVGVAGSRQRWRDADRWGCSFGWRVWDASNTPTLLRVYRTRHPTPRAYCHERAHSPLTTHHSPLTTHPLTTQPSPSPTHHSPLNPHHSTHSPLTTHHSPLTTYHSQPTTHHPLLTTH